MVLFLGVSSPLCLHNPHPITPPPPHKKTTPRKRTLSGLKRGKTLFDLFYDFFCDGFGSSYDDHFFYLGFFQIVYGFCPEDTLIG
jgi:hypothetical protein